MALLLKVFSPQADDGHESHKHDHGQEGHDGHEPYFMEYEPDGAVAAVGGIVRSWRDWNQLAQNVWIDEKINRVAEGSHSLTIVGGNADLVDHAQREVVQM